MTLERTLACGIQIWKPNRRVIDGGKIIKTYTQESYVPIKADTIRSEEAYCMKYMSSTGMQTIGSSGQSNPTDVITLVYGDITVVGQKHGSQIIEKVKISWDSPKVVVVPVDKCSYGILAISSNTSITVKKNYKQSVLSTEKLIF